MNETDGQGYGSWRPTLSLTDLCSAPSVPEFLRITRAADVCVRPDRRTRETRGAHRLSDVARRIPCFVSQTLPPHQLSVISRPASNRPADRAAVAARAAPPEASTREPHPIPPDRSEIISRNGEPNAQVEDEIGREEA